MNSTLYGFALISPLIVCIVIFLFSANGRRREIDVGGITFPGPRSDPIIGHARIFPQEHPWKTFTEWRKKFGMRFCVKVYLLYIELKVMFEN